MDGDELEVAAPDGAVALVLPEEGARLVGVAVEEVRPFQRTRRGAGGREQNGEEVDDVTHTPLTVPARITPGQRAMNGVAIPPS